MTVMEARAARIRARLAELGMDPESVVIEGMTVNGYWRRMPDEIDGRAAHHREFVSWPFEKSVAITVLSA